MSKMAFGMFLSLYLATNYGTILWAAIRTNLFPSFNKPMRVLHSYYLVVLALVKSSTMTYTQAFLIPHAFYLDSFKKNPLIILLSTNYGVKCYDSFPSSSITYFLTRTLEPEYRLKN